MRYTLTRHGDAPAPLLRSRRPPPALHPGRRGAARRAVGPLAPGPPARARARGRAAAPHDPLGRSRPRPASWSPRRARAVLAETEALRGEIDELRGLVRGRVTVGAMLFGGELDIPGDPRRVHARVPRRRGRPARGHGAADARDARRRQPRRRVRARGERARRASSGSSSPAKSSRLAMSPATPLAGEGPLRSAGARRDIR